MVKFRNQTACISVFLTDTLKISLLKTNRCMHGKLANKILLTLMILCLQGQAMAAVWIPCAHGGDHWSGASNVSCHMVEKGAADSQSSAQSHFDCQKCTIAAVCSLYDLPSSAIVLVSFAVSRLSALPIQQHLYRFDPDRLKRPPIPHFA